MKFQINPGHTVFFLHLILHLMVIPRVTGSNFLPGNMKFHHISIKEGLANNRVDCMLQDHEGYLWFGTKRGLCKYNGYDFTIYKSHPGDSTSLRYHQISELWEDSANRLWVGTVGGGLHLYNRETDRFSPVRIHPDSYPGTFSGRVISLLSLPDSEILVLHTFGITRINGNSGEIESFKHVIQSRDLPGKVTAGFKDPSGLVLIAIENEQLIYWYDTHSNIIRPFQWESGDKDLPGKIHQFFAFDEENLWLATDEGLFRFNKTNGKMDRSFKGDFPGTGENLNFIIEDYEKNLWLGGEGLFYYDTKKAVFFQLQRDDSIPESYKGNILTCGMADNQKNVWLGTFSRGLNVKYFLDKHFNPDKKLSNLIDNLSKNITAICKSENGLLFLGTWDKGLLIIDKNHQQISIERSFPELDFLRDKIIRSIEKDKNGNIWIGTNDGVLVRVDPLKKQAKKFSINPDITFGAITSFLFPGQDEVCFAGDWDVFFFDTGANRVIKQETQHQQIPTVMDLTEDKEGNIWVASYSHGLFQIKKDKTITRFKPVGTESGKFPEDKFVTIFEDSRNRLWVGTEFNGLFLLHPDEKKVEQFTVKDGLSSNDICSIQEDSKGRLWIGTNNGLTRFNYSINDFKIYYWSDGLNADEFHYNSNCIGHGKTHYFGGTNGLVFFDPDEIRDSYMELPVKIENISINHGAVLCDSKGNSIHGSFRTNQSLKLKHNQNTVSFKYTTLNYSLARKSNFAYKLKGFEENFNYVNQQRQVTYTNLSPGNYVFRVIASNNDNIWYETGDAFAFSIKRPPWLTWWAFIIYTVLFILIIYAFLHQIRHEEKMKHAIQMERMEKRKQKELSQMKLRFFTNISHEFKTPLTLIIGPLEQLIAEQHGNSRLRHKLTQISLNSRRLLELINQLIDFRKMEQDVLPLDKQQNDLIITIQKIMELFKGTAIKKEIGFLLHTDAEEIIFNFDRDKIEKVLSNILSNAFKYTEKGGNIEVAVTLNSNNNVCITVTDSGTGIPKEKIKKVSEWFYSGAKQNMEPQEASGSGIGLAYSKKLTELHGGTFIIENAAKKGTRVLITLPYDQKHPEKDSEKEMPQNYIETEITANYPEQPEAPEKTELTNAPRILIVEDDDELRTYVRTILNRYYLVDEAKNGADGLEMARKNDYDLIVSDVIMPKMSGTEMCKRLKSNIKTSHILVVLLTAKNDLYSEIEGYKTGADSYIGKPFLPTQLTAVIVNLLKTRQHIKEHFASIGETEAEPIGISVEDKDFIKKAIQMTELRLDDQNFGVEELGKELGLSRTHLYRKLKSLTGLSPLEFVRQVRLKKAAQLLRTEDLTVSEVAYEVGFNFAANFSTSFKALFGLSPKEYQNKFKT